jgi:dihydrolipoamide dehydrogenase
VFEWEDLPESIAVIGAGVIALELGQALHRLGVRVRLFGRSDGIAHLGDPEVNQAAVSALGDELDMQLRATLLEARRDGGGAVLRWRGGDGIERTDRYSCVLAATGRVPNIASLELRNGGVLLDAHGLPQYDPDTLQCDGSGIFIAGDVTDQRLLLHDAAAQGRTAGDNAGRYPEIKPGLRHAPLAIAFTDPQMASVGARYSDLPRGRFAIGQVSFEDQGRSRVMRKNRGLLRVYGEHGSGRFLGAEMVAPHAEHLAHLLAWACQAGMSVAQILEMPYYHPTIEEGVRTALRDLKEQLLHGLPEIEHCTDCTPGM